MRHGIGQSHENQYMQARRTRLRSETRLLTAMVQEMNGRAVGHIPSSECNARQRRKAQQVFANAPAKGRLAGKVCIEMQGRSTQGCRPPSPLGSNFWPNKKRLQRTVGAALPSKGCFFWHRVPAARTAENLRTIGRSPRSAPESERSSRSVQSPAGTSIAAQLQSPSHRVPSRGS